MKQQSLHLDVMDKSSCASAHERRIQEQGIALPITLIRAYLNVEQQDALLRESSGYLFQSPEIEVYGQRYKIPRSQIWFGDMYCDTLYSGLLVNAQPWPKYANRLRQKLQRDFALLSNGVLVNRYVDGKESMGWHSDNEPEFAKGSDIASITLGASRDFVIRHKLTHEQVSFELQSGDLLIMHWPMQETWEHSLPKRIKITEPRINYTFRQVVAHFFDEDD